MITIAIINVMIWLTVGSLGLIAIIFLRIYIIFGSTGTYMGSRMILYFSGAFMARLTLSLSANIHILFTLISILESLSKIMIDSPLSLEIHKKPFGILHQPN